MKGARFLWLFVISGVAHANCIPGDQLFFAATNPQIHDAVARDKVTYTSDLKEIKLSSKAQTDLPHRVFLYAGFWLATADWCYDTDSNSIKILHALRHAITGKEIAYGGELWIGYSSLDDSDGDCIRGNIVNNQEGKPWNQEKYWESGDGKKYEEVSEGYYSYSEGIDEFTLKGKPASGTQISLNGNIGGFPVGTYLLDWCYNPVKNSIRFLNKPLRNAAYAQIPGGAWNDKQYFSVLYNEKRN